MLWGARGANACRLEAGGTVTVKCQRYLPSLAMVSATPGVLLVLVLVARATRYAEAVRLQ